MLPTRVGVTQEQRERRRAIFVEHRQSRLDELARADDGVLGSGFSEFRCACGETAGTALGFMPGMAEDVPSVCRMVRLCTGLEPMPAELEDEGYGSRCESCGTELGASQVVHTLHASFREDDRKDLVVELWWQEDGQPRALAELRSEDGKHTEQATSPDALMRLLASGPAEPSAWMRAQRYLEVGGERFEAGDLEAAERHFRKVLELRPRHRLAHFNLGVTLARRGESEQAQACFRTATEINPWDCDSHFNLVQLYLERDALPGAESAARRALESLPDEARFHRVLGHILGKMERYPEAAGALRRCVELEPDEPSGWFFLGMACEQQPDRREEAIEAYRRCLELKPDRDGVRFVKQRLKKLGASRPGWLARLLRRS